KGSSFAARGVLLPPYDTAATLPRLERVLARRAPRAVVALGGSFPRGDRASRLAGSHRPAPRAPPRRRARIRVAGHPDSRPAFAELFGTLAFTAHMLGEERLYAVAARRCLAD